MQYKTTTIMLSKGFRIFLEIGYIKNTANEPHNAENALIENTESSSR